MDGNDNTAEPEGVEPPQDCQCNSLKEELQRLQDEFIKKQNDSAAVKSYLEGRLNEAAQSTAALQKQVASAEKKAERFRDDNDELSKELANLRRQYDQLTEDATSAKEDLVKKLSAKRQKTKYDELVLLMASLEQRAETAEKKAEEADQRVFKAEQRAADALKAANDAKTAEEKSTAKAAETVSEAVRRRNEAECRAQQLEEQLSLSQEKRAEADAAAAKALQSATDVAVSAAVTDLVLEAELLQTKNSVEETLRKLAAAEKEAQAAKDHAGCLETKRTEAEQLAEEAVRSINEALDKAADVNRKLAEVNTEAESQRKMDSEAMTRALSSEAKAEQAQGLLLESRRQLDAESQRVAAAETRAFNAELRAECATREMESLKSKLESQAAKAKRLADEAEVKARDATHIEAERDEAERRAAEARRELKEEADQAAVARNKLAEVTSEAENFRKLASEAKNQAEDALQRLAEERERAADLGRRASEAEHRLDCATREAEDKLANAECMAAIADRKALELDLKVKDAEKRADREVADANKSAAEAYRRIADAEKKVEEAREARCQAEQAFSDAEAKARDQIAEAEQRATEAIRKTVELEKEKAELMRKIDALQRDLKREHLRSGERQDSPKEAMIPTTSSSASGNDFAMNTPTSSPQSSLGHAVDPIVRNETGSSHGAGRQSASLDPRSQNDATDVNTPGADDSRSEPSDVPATPSVNSGSCLGDQPPSKKARHTTVAATRVNRRRPVSGPVGPSIAEPSVSASHPPREADVMQPGTSSAGGSTGGTHQMTHGQIDHLLLTQFRPIVVDLSSFNIDSSTTSEGPAASTGSAQGQRASAKKKPKDWTRDEDAAIKKIFVDSGLLSADDKILVRNWRDTVPSRSEKMWQAHEFKGNLHRRGRRALRDRCIRLISALEREQTSKE